METTSSKHIAVAKEYFEANSGEEVVHITSDGQVFFQKNHGDAVNHQLRIDDKTPLVTIYKSKLDEEQADDKGGDEIQLEKKTKKDIAAWLTEKGVALTGKENKEELILKVNEVRAAEAAANAGGTGDQK